MSRIHALPTRHPHVTTALATATEHLATADERLAEVIGRIGPCGLRREPGGFGQVFRAILSQQLSGKAAATIRGRIVAACGGRVTPEHVLALPDRAFAEAGVSRPKARYLRALAETVRDDPRFFERLPRLSDEAAIERLTSLLGVGQWTAEMYLIFSLGRLDVLPLGDVSILAAAAELHGIRRSRILKRLPRLSEPWRPYRSVAVWYLYAHLDTRRAQAR
ncbi:MAG: DNA-3-methyladenine glycosylase family protein [Acidobacteriota bacterium]